MITDHRLMTIDLKTVNELVYEQMRARIVRNELGPGAPLVLADLATEFGTSTMPVRSALSMLQAEGLVRQVRHRGATVAPLEIEDLEVIQAVRIGIEGFAAAMGAEALSREGGAEMTRMLERCEEALKSLRSPDRLLEMQWRMHEICYLAAGRPRLLDLIRQYRHRAERYIRLAVGKHAPDQMPLQKKLVQACRRNDGEAAQRAIHDALAWTVEILRPVLLEFELETAARDVAIGRVARSE